MNVHEGKVQASTPTTMAAAVVDSKVVIMFTFVGPGDLRLSGSIIRKSRFFFTKERRNISQKSGRFYHSKERFSQVMTSQVIMK